MQCNFVAFAGRQFYMKCSWHHSWNDFKITLYTAISPRGQWEQSRLENFSKSTKRHPQRLLSDNIINKSGGILSTYFSRSQNVCSFFKNSSSVLIICLCKLQIYNTIFMVKFTTVVVVVVVAEATVVISVVVVVIHVDVAVVLAAVVVTVTTVIVTMVTLIWIVYTKPYQNYTVHV